MATDSTAAVEREPVTLAAEGLSPKKIYSNLIAPALIEEAARRGEITFTDHGAVAVVTSPHTGRSPRDKFVVDEGSCSGQIWWEKNQKMEAAAFDRLHADVKGYLNGQEVFVQDLFGGADPAYRLPVRFVTPNAWHALFVRNMFIRPEAADLATFAPQFTVLHAPEFQADPARHGTRTGTVIALNFEKRLIIIAGTRYAGEMKKSIFTVLNYLLPQQGVLPMHCSANVGPKGDTAVFFGLSGTGKTTLSADPSRSLVGDDEHGWSDHGVFNFEGGCYAKVIKLRPDTEPEIYGATQMFGTVLENVELDPATRAVDYDSTTITENTRACYPIDYIPNHRPDGQGGIPKNIVLLTADAYGVMPPIAKLTEEQARYQFLAGYTAKVAGTERGVTEPSATFSACFGAPFLPLHPAVYSKMLGEKIRQHGVNVWLVNTGWTGGPYGVGSRMKLAYTRAMVNAALSGELDKAEYTTEPVFGFRVPTAVPGVPSEVLNPRGTWSDPAAYDAQAKKLAAMFRENFKPFEAEVPEAVRQAGPKI
ncbi:MAG TPA: phosphoenolpyruvate carboxykinase [Gemmatimonadales bacterium]|nr:phosphoenolpyruvate carboxykinase [Gemmatimonadales bacterium]